MVPGVHASIAVAQRPEEVRAALDEPGWPWLGQPGPMATRRVPVGPGGGEGGCVRIFAPTGGARHAPLWRLQVAGEAADLLAAEPLLDVQLLVETASGGGTRLRLSGRFARDLARRGAAVPLAASRTAANALARSLLEVIATTVEARSTAASGGR